MSFRRLLGVDEKKRSTDTRGGWQNFSVLAEFTTETGKIKHPSLTGLRSVNQRKIAKAIRRAIGIGLIPSVHKHPMLLRGRNQ